MIPVHTDDEGAPLGCFFIANRSFRKISCLSIFVIAVESKTRPPYHKFVWLLVATSHATPRGSTSKVKRNGHRVVELSELFPTVYLATAESHARV